MAEHDTEDQERRVLERAQALWEAEGRPAGRDPAEGHAEYLDKARAALAIEDNPEGATQPVGQMRGRPTRRAGQPAEAIENQGEFPGLTDQGTESPEPPRRPSRRPVATRKGKPS
jgi:hypothetical protein